MVRQMTISPPMTPPTMAPMFVDFCEEDTAGRSGIGDGDEKPAEVLRGEPKEGDCCVAIGIDCETKLAEETLDIALGVDVVDVVDASTLFGTGSRVCVPACLPQAMYSYD
jgi:hypothetical protein